MEHYCTMLHHHLQKDIEHCKQKMLAYDNEVECCFQIANKYWRELSERLKNHEFHSEKEEIEFFKKWKPIVTCEIEYYNLVYHALLFQPTDFDSLIIFWGREYKRMEKFRADQKEFIKCYKDDRSELNPYYFLRKYFEPKYVPEARIYETDPLLSTNGDPLVACFLALGRYETYSREKIASF